ncbi:extracellular solute-binding protein [Desulfopila sp. IMCC35008]|uniref:extracellular solute-binding protein n=1 Tax=Desulfopila sp. IMCC35008 TaxID=2653858 RepID=UPI00197AD139|nr:extracellular solute-binding protein [Desulfopila sp. IMCC35008]
MIKKIQALLATSVLALSITLPTTGLAQDMEEKVVVYSTHGEAMLEMVADAYQNETGIKVDFINLKGALADRIRAEKANPQSDVMYGAPSSVFLEMKSEGLFDAFTPSWAEKINPLFKDTDSYWYGTIQTPVMMFYNTEMLPEADAPKDWYDLVNPRFKNSLVFRNALSSSARATYSALLQQFESKGELESGWKFMKELDANTKNYYGSGSMLFQAVGRKEAAVSFMVLNSIIDNKIKNKMPLAVIDAQSGSPVITDGIALIHGAKHPNAAKSFIEFAGSAKVQALLAQKFNRLPTHPDALADSPEWMANASFKVMDVDWQALAAKQSGWIQKWDSEIKSMSKDKKKK